MRSSIYEQFAIVREDTASLFTDKLNETILRLKDNDPVVKFSESDPLCAYIKYSISETTPETISEASEINGVSFTCSQCPYFVPVCREDGEIDKRCKYGDCPHTDLGRTYKNSAACDILYELIKEGGVKVCFTESE